MSDRLAHLVGRNTQEQFFTRKLAERAKTRVYFVSQPAAFDEMAEGRVIRTGHHHPRSFQFEIGLKAHSYDRRAGLQRKIVGGGDRRDRLLKT